MSQINLHINKKKIIINSCISFNSSVKGEFGNLVIYIYKKILHKSTNNNLAFLRCKAAQVGQTETDTNYTQSIFHWIALSSPPSPTLHYDRFRSV